MLLSCLREASFLCCCSAQNFGKSLLDESLQSYFFPIKTQPQHKISFKFKCDFIFAATKDFPRADASVKDCLKDLCNLNLVKLWTKLIN